MKHLTEQERRLATKVVKAALAKGYRISVCDGEEWVVKKSTDFDQIADAMASTGEDTLRFRDAAGNVMGTMLFIWGNGKDIIADYSDNAEMVALSEVIDHD